MKWYVFIDITSVCVHSILIQCQLRSIQQLKSHKNKGQKTPDVLGFPSIHRRDQLESPYMYLNVRPGVFLWPRSEEYLVIVLSVRNSFPLTTFNI